MPFILCDKHGGNIAPHTCPHVADKVARGVTVGNVRFVDLDGFFFKGWLCESCFAIDGLHDFLLFPKDDLDENKELERQLDAFIERIDFKPVCPKCLEALMIIPCRDHG